MHATKSLIDRDQRELGLYWALKTARHPIYIHNYGGEFVFLEGDNLTQPHAELFKIHRLYTFRWIVGAVSIRAAQIDFFGKGVNNDI